MAQETAIQPSVYVELAAERRAIAASWVSAVVQSEADKEVASEMIARCRKYQRAVEEARVALVKPINDHVKFINSEAKKLSVPVEKLTSFIVGLVNAFDAQVNAAAIAEEQRRAAESRAQVARNEPPSIAPVVQRASRTVRTESGTTSYVPHWEFNIEDEAKLPRDYLMPNVPAIRTAVNAGIAIPGVKAWQESRPKVR